MAVMLSLVTSANFGGAELAIDEVFSASHPNDRPSRQAFAALRKKISFKFFAEKLRELGSNHCSENISTFRGLKLIAIDGDQYRVNRVPELETHGFRGFAKSNNRETRGVILFGCTAVDVLSGIPVDADFSSFGDERGLAQRILKRLNPVEKTVFIMDRGFLCSEILKIVYNRYFVARCTIKSGYKAVEWFVKSGERTAIAELSGYQVRLIRIDKSGHEPKVIATNLPPDFGWKSINEIYQKRWEIENFNREMTSTLAVEQFHCKTLNGLLQEIFAALIFKFTASSLIAKGRILRRPHQMGYFRSNFKRIVQNLRKNIKDIILGFRLNEIVVEILALVKISAEKRRANSRFNPREIRYPRKERFPYNSSVPKRQSPGRHVFAT